MGKSLAGQVVIVTGASSGIGEAAARHFAREGCKVVLAARRVERLEAVAQEIQHQGGEALVVQSDLSQLCQIERLVEAALGKYHQIDILLNNAGFGRLNWLDQLDLELDIHALLAVNLEAVIAATRLVLPSMLARGRGHIINLASLASFIPTPTYSIYSASKAGVRAFTDALRREVQIKGISVSGVYPGAVFTEFQDHIGGKRKIKLQTPTRFVLRPDDVARVIVQVARHPRRSVVIPWFANLAIWANSLVPGIVDFVIQEGFVRRERQ
jgi:short-subunit dehydrogenase